MEQLDDYVGLLLALPHIEPITVLSLFFLTLARILPIAVFIPFLGPKVVPPTIKMMFSIAFTAIFLPQNLFLVKQNIPFDGTFIGLLLKELGIGFILSVMASVPFLVATSAGNLIDFQRGASSLQVQEPTTQTESSPIGNLLYFVLLALFFTVGGPFIFFNALADSYTFYPVDQWVPSLFFAGQSPFWQKVIALFGSVMVLSIQLALPALIALLLCDIFLGIANRMAPQVQIVFLGMPLKSWAGIALLTVGWTLIVHVMETYSTDWMRTLHQLLIQSPHI